MKGIIFNILEEFIDKNLGEEKFDEILDKIGFDETIVGPGTYSNEVFFDIVTHATSMAGLPLEDVVRSFGKFTFPFLAQGYPSFLEPHSNAKSFLKTVHDIIHVEVEKLYKDTELPDLKYISEDEKSLVIEYRSPKKLCYFMEGLIEGVSEHYNENIEYSQTLCLHKGDDHCCFSLKF